jgi:hypothetical protein
MKNNNYYNVLLKKILNETLEDKAKEVMEKLKFNKPGTSFDYVEGEMCESCGGEIREGEACESCGYSKNSEVLETHKSYRNNNKLSDSDIEEITERLFGKQKNIDKNKNNRIDSEDFKMLRNKKETCEECGSRSMEEEETYEGNAFTKKLKQTPKGGKFKLGNKEYTDNSSLEESNSVLYKLNSDYGSELFTENEIINLIENIIIEEKEKNNIKKGKTPAGLEAYEKAHKGSGKENENYMKEFSKKMLDYTKSGSKEKFNTNPKHFPKGNGELEKMEKKAYEVSDDGNEFIDDYLRPGMQTLDYDEMHPNEDWMDDNIEGSSKTGNNKEWANSEETDINKNINKTRKKGSYNKAKRAAYNKSPQPIISDKPGQETGKGLKLNNESVDHKSQIKLTEEFNRMKLLMGYKEKTQ